MIVAPMLSSSAGEPCRVVVGAVGEPDEVEVPEDYADLLAGLKHRLALRRGHRYAVDDDAAGVGPRERVDGAEERGLAGTRLRDNAEERPPAHLDRHVVERDDGVGAVAEASPLCGLAWAALGGGYRTLSRGRNARANM